MSDETNPNPSGDGSNRIPFLRLEKYLLDEVSLRQKKQVEEDASKNPDIAASLSDLPKMKSALGWQQIKNQLPPSIPETDNRTLVEIVKHRLGEKIRVPSKPMMAWAGALVLLVVMAPILISQYVGSPDIRFKGKNHPEIILEVDGQPIPHGKTRSVAPGGVLSFSYRTPNPLFIQVWYSDDGGPPELFAGKEDANLSWAASSSWQKPPQRIRLEGNWKDQRVMILSSTKMIPMEEARRIILDEAKPKAGAEVFTYYLKQP